MQNSLLREINLCENYNISRDFVQNVRFSYGLSNFVR